MGIALLPQKHVWFPANSQDSSTSARSVGDLPARIALIDPSCCTLLSREAMKSALGGEAHPRQDPRCLVGAGDADSPPDAAISMSEERATTCAMPAAMIGDSAHAGIAMASSLMGGVK